MKAMIRTFLTTSLIALSLTAGAADWGVKSVERSLETNTRLLQIPDSASGELGVQQCDTCPRIALQLTTNTQFFVGQDSVTLSELRQFAFSGSNGHFAMVFYELNTPTVLRVVVTGQLPKP
jgi:hypothetical protein